jgi:hypothetical protein
LGIWQNIQGWTCVLGIQEPAPIWYCQGPCISVTDENGETRILHTFAIHCFTWCSTSLCVDSTACCYNATGKWFSLINNQIINTYQEYNGKINFTTDSWSSPNHHALVTFSAHFEHKGEPLSIPLDVVEVGKVKTYLCGICTCAKRFIVPHQRRACRDICQNARRIWHIRKGNGSKKITNLHATKSTVHRSWVWLAIMRPITTPWFVNWAARCWSLVGQPLIPGVSSTP